MIDRSKAGAVRFEVPIANQQTVQVDAIELDVLIKAGLIQIKLVASYSDEAKAKVLRCIADLNQASVGMSEADGGPGERGVLRR